MSSVTPKKNRVGNARSAARLAAVQALYQRDMSGVPVAVVLSEFHNHRLGVEVEGELIRDADVDFFNDIVKGVDARNAEIDDLIGRNLAKGWAMDRLDRPLRAILRAGIYELVARPDVPTATVINEYLDVAHAFYEATESKFANGLLDSVAKQVRS